MLNNEFSSLKGKVVKDIASEIIFSPEPGKILRKWRETFAISQKELAKEFKVTSSVICDYETGRRKSPGTHVIKRYIDALMLLDERKGGKTVKELSGSSPQPLGSVVIDMREFFNGVSVRDFCKLIGANFTHENFPYHEVYGYTIIDSIRAITELSFNDMIKLYGNTTKRALIFTKVSTGRTPIVAIKLTNLKPSLVVLHGIGEIDPVAKSIAEGERLPVALSESLKIEEIIEKLRVIE